MKFLIYNFLVEKTLYRIFKTFFKVGTLLLGGGYVILPLLQAELVDKKMWLKDDELCEYFALSQSVPG
ncbi:chromate transporter, partial [bacterium]|nr:chromate transporter [bacterium]